MTPDAFDADRSDDGWPEPGGGGEDVRIEGDRVAFACAVCGRELQTHRGKAGRTAPCPQCGQPVTVPDTGFPREEAPTPRRRFGEPRPAPCPVCGEKNPAGAAVCGGCGEPLPEASRDPVRPRGGRFRRRTGTVSLEETFRVGWALTTQHFGLLLGGAALVAVALFAVGCLIGVPVGVVSAVAAGNFGGPPKRPDAATALMNVGLNQVAQLITAAATALLLAGYVRIRLNLARHGRADVETLLRERGVWASAAVTTVIFNLMTTAPFAFAWAVASAGDGGLKMIGLDPAMFAGPPGRAGPIFDFDPALTAVAGVAFVLQIVLSVLFWPYLFLCVDYKMTGLTPLAAAWRVTEGSRWQLLGLTVIQGIVMFVASIPCGLGLIGAVPLIAAWNVAAYEQISGNHATAGRSQD